MNRTFKSTLFAMLALGLVASQQTYQLVWSDEFNGNSLDTSKWQYEVNCDGGGNNELQCYTKSDQNLKVGGGYLTVTAKPQYLNGKQYTSARINTKASAAWKYGRFEARAKMPRGDYLWPALWMMPRDSVYGGWAASGEIDIYEGRGQNPNEYQSTLHYGGSWPNNVYQGSGARNAGVDLTADFHTYTCEWTADQISFAIDGKVYYTRNLNVNFWSGKGNSPYSKNRQPFDQPFFYIINLAVGGGFFGGNANTLTTDMANRWQNPQMVVDYVRVYQLSDNPTPPVPVPTSNKPTAAPSSKADETVSVGVSTAVSTGATSRVSTAASSAVSTAASSGATTFLYSKKASTPGSSTPVSSTPSSNNGGNNNNNNACPQGCGSGSCCNDEKLGGVCYNTATHNCVSGAHLCAVGNGWCGSHGCYQLSLYKCNNGVLASI